MEKYGMMFYGYQRADCGAPAHSTGLFVRQHNRLPTSFLIFKTILQFYKCCYQRFFPCQNSSIFFIKHKPYYL